MSDNTVTGTNGNDLMFIQGEVTHLTTTITNAYSGQTFEIDEEMNLNSATYEGLVGIDTLFLSNIGDALFLTDTSGNQVLMNIERVIAGDGGDVIVLDSDTITLGDLFIDGGRGDDIIWANEGDDIIRGFDGNDYLDGGPGNDEILGQNDNDFLTGGTGNDTLDGGAGADILAGGEGDDTLLFFADVVWDGGVMAYNIGSPGIDGTAELKNARNTNGSLDIFDGGEGYDTLVMTEGSDTLFIEDPYHEFHEDGSALRLIDVEQIDAGAGDDIIDLTSTTTEYGDILINGGDGNDTLWASTGNDTINGDDGDDNLWGGVGNDVLYGGAGNDIIVGGPNADSGAIQTTLQQHLFTAADSMAPGIVDGDLSVGFQTSIDVTFVESDAAFHNVLGFYTVGQDGTIENVSLVFPNAKDFNAGDTVTIDLPADSAEFGFFMIANGAHKNNNFSKLDLESGEFSFVHKTYGQNYNRLARVTDGEDDIMLVFNDGSSDSVIVGSNNHIYHTTLRDGATNLNGDNETHVISGSSDSGATLRIGFEDLPNLGDEDYNDLVFDVSVNPYETQELVIDDNDVLYGGAGDDVMDGGVGDDILFGQEGADTLTGGQGADVFAFDVLDGMIDTITDFNASEGDTLNIAEILVGYDELTSAIEDFVQLADNNGNTDILVNADGDVGGMFTTVATVEGGVSGATASDLIDSGTLIANHSVVV